MALRRKSICSCARKIETDKNWKRGRVEPVHIKERRREPSQKVPPATEGFRNCYASRRCDLPRESSPPRPDRLLRDRRLSAFFCVCLPVGADFFFVMPSARWQDNCQSGGAMAVEFRRESVQFSPNWEGSFQHRGGDISWRLNDFGAPKGPGVFSRAHPRGPTSQVELNSLRHAAAVRSHIRKLGAQESTRYPPESRSKHAFVRAVRHSANSASCL